MGDNARNERSYSSASTTYSALPPERALPRHLATRPPTIPVGSRPAAANRSVIITVVVVLPCVPETATTVPPSTTACRASARLRTGSPDSRAAISSGWSGWTAEVCITARAPLMCRGSWPSKSPAPAKSTSRTAPGSTSHPVTTTPRCCVMSASAPIPAPPIPMK